MYDELVRRLREMSEWSNIEWEDYSDDAQETMKEAADVIDMKCKVGHWIEYDELVRRLRDNEHEIDCSLCDRDCCYPDGKFHGKCIIIEAADAIEELQKQRDEWESHAALAESFAQGWIPVTERLPKEYAEVLVFTRTGKIAFDRLESLVAYSIPDFRKFGVGAVTHWMPLPEPPKEE